MVKKKSQFEEYKYIVGIIAASILVSIGLILIVGRPLYASLKKTNLELDEKKVVLQKLEANLQTLKGLDSRKAEIEEKNQKVLAALPADKDVPRLFTQLEQIARSAGVSINSVSETSGTDLTQAKTQDQATIKTNQISTITYTVSGTASSYSALKTALAKIESALRIVTIDKVDVQSSSGAGELSVTLTVSTYTRGQ